MLVRDTSIKPPEKRLSPSELRLETSQALKTRRQSLGLTQQELSVRLQRYKGFISRVENGGANLSLDTLELFLNALGWTATVVDGACLRESVGTRVRTARENQGISQETLGHIAGLSALYVGRVERAEVSTSLDQLELLAHALNLNGSELIESKTFVTL